MKKIIRLLSLIFAVTIFVIYSCTKENNTSNEKPGQQSNLSANDIKVNNLINGFKKKMAYYREHPELKSGENLPADSALWYLEATINYSHGFPNEYYEEFHTDSLTLTVLKNSDGEVDLTELTQKYDQMKADVATAYNASAYTEKGLALVDIEEVSETDNEIVLSVKSTTGKINPDPDTTKYNYIGDWYYGENQGYCDGSGGEADASEQFEKTIMNLIYKYGKEDSFFTDIIDVEVKGGDPDFLVNSSVEPNNHLDYYLYYSVEGTAIPWNEDMLCIPDADMHAYNDLIYDLLFDFLPNDYLPANNGGQKYYIMSYTEFKDGKGALTPPKYEYFHYGKFKYGYDTEYSAGNNPTEIQ